MRHLAKTFLFILVTFQLSGQNAPDFTISDSGGQSHTLYEDYLDKGTTAVSYTHLTLPTTPYV